MWTIWNTIKNYTMNLWWITKILLSQNLPKHNCDEDKWYQCFLKLKYEYIQNNVSKIYPLSSTFFYLNEFLIFHWCQMNEETKRHQCLGFKKIVKEKEYINIGIWIYTQKWRHLKGGFRKNDFRWQYVNYLEKMSDIILMWKAPRILYFLLFVFLLLNLWLNYISKRCCWINCNKESKLGLSLGS